MTHAVRMHDERVAFLSLEKLIWRAGPVCPHCGEAHRLGRLSGLSTPIGSWKCYACRKPFSVRHGTIFQNSHVPLHVWLQGLYLLTVSGHRLSSQKLGQILGVSVRTAWHLKTKIAAGLAAGAPFDGGPDERMLTQVVRTPMPDEPQPPEPGQAIFKARYERFLKAIGPLADADGDAAFLDALHRLVLSAPPEQSAAAGETAIEEQLELGLFEDEPECQMTSDGGDDELR